MQPKTRVADTGTVVLIVRLEICRNDVWRGGGASVTRIRIVAPTSSLLPPRLLPVFKWALQEQWHGIRMEGLDREQKTRG